MSTTWKKNTLSTWDNKAYPGIFVHDQSTEEDGPRFAIRRYGQREPLAVYKSLKHAKNWVEQHVALGGLTTGMLDEIRRKALKFCTDNPKFSGYVREVYEAMKTGATVALKHKP